ncbi:MULTISPECIES: hypothetical protein [unclassified Brevundimonas]|uniref:hypothetical protein n=1 Tax=unclassified Brevundimonas TaxID=2622653 RepID=UPI003F8E4641
MFGRLGRRRFETPSSGLKGDRPEVPTSTDDLLSLLQVIETAAGEVYGRHGLPQQRGHYRRPTDGDVWEPLGDALSPAEKWALVDSSPEGGRWRYAAYEALGAGSDVPAVRRASALLAACQGLRQRLADRATISAQDLADSIRLGEAWSRLATDTSIPKFLPPDEAG